MQAENARKQNMMSIKDINNLFESLENFYYSVMQLGYYLPKIGCPTITSDYLLGVVKGKYFYPKKEEICAGGAYTVKQRSKVQLYEILLGLLNVEDRIELGFDISKLPNKQFLLDLICYFDPENSLFKLSDKEEEDQHLINFPIELFKDVQTRVLPASSGVIFKRSKEQILQDTLKQKESKIKRKEQRLKMLKFEEERALKNIQSIKDNIQGLNVRR